MMNDEQERIWMDTVVAYSRCYLKNFLKELKNNTKNFGQNIRRRIRKLNRSVPEYKRRDNR
jgi:hypothetical protein